MPATRRILALLGTLAVAGTSAAHAASVTGPTWFDDGFGTPIDVIRQWLGVPEQHPAQKHLVSVSPEESVLTITFANGRTLRVALNDGHVNIDDHQVGRYQVGGPLDRAWQRFVTAARRSRTEEVVELAHAWNPQGLTGDDAQAAEQIRRRFAAVGAPSETAVPPQQIPAAGPGGLTANLDDLSDPAALEPKLLEASRLRGGALRVTVPGGQARLGNFSVGSGETIRGHLLVLDGDADIYGTLTGNLATVHGDVVVHPGAVVLGDVLAIDGKVNAAGGEIRGEIRTLSPPTHLARAADEQAIPSLTPLQATLRKAAGVLGVFVTLAMLGFGTVLFGRQPLEVVSDTVMNSFGRSFLTGLVGQILVLPTFGMIVVGLILSVAGILLLPFAVIAYALLVIVAVLGGLLAVTHAMGETYTRRRLAQGALIGSPNSYRFVLVGLAALMSIWAAWVVFGWVPAAGTLIQGIAMLVTWLLGTVGFGAALLSRGGFREQFAGRLIPPEALTDEYLWATPQFGVPAVRRPGSGPGGTRTPTEGL